jgi:hypothetical protein
MLESYEEEILFFLFDNGIIEMNYCSIQKAARIIRWQEIARKHKVKKGFSSALRRLSSKGYVDLHGKSGDVISLSRLGIFYVKGKLKK